MARYRKKRRSSGKAKAIPVALAAPLADVGFRVGKALMSGDTNKAALYLTGYSPIDQAFSAPEFLRTYGSLGVGIVVHKVANKTGLNNYVRRATMGFLSI